MANSPDNAHALLSQERPKLTFTKNPDGTTTVNVPVPHGEKQVSLQAIQETEGTMRTAIRELRELTGDDRMAFAIFHLVTESGVATGFMYDIKKYIGALPLATPTQATGLAKGVEGLDLVEDTDSNLPLSTKERMIKESDIPAEGDQSESKSDFNVAGVSKVLFPSPNTQNRTEQSTLPTMMDVDVDPTIPSPKLRLAERMLGSISDSNEHTHHAAATDPVVEPRQRLAERMLGPALEADVGVVKGRLADRLLPGDAQGQIDLASGERNISPNTANNQQPAQPDPADDASKMDVDMDAEGESDDMTVYTRKKANPHSGAPSQA